MAKKTRLTIFISAVVVMTVAAVVLLSKAGADPIPPPDVVIPFTLVEEQPNRTIYRAKVVFAGTAGYLPDGVAKWDETDVFGNKTGRTWVLVPSVDKKWDIVPVRDGSFGTYETLSILNQKNPGQGFDATSLAAFQSSNPEFRFMNTGLEYGKDDNSNGTLDLQERTDREWYLADTKPAPNCVLRDVGKNWTTIIEIIINHNGKCSSPPKSPQTLNYPVWFVN